MITASRNPSAETGSPVKNERTGHNPVDGSGSRAFEKRKSIAEPLIWEVSLDLGGSI